VLTHIIAVPALRTAMDNSRSGGQARAPRMTAPHFVLAVGTDRETSFASYREEYGKSF
jgi:hypothetical protein